MMQSKILIILLISLTGCYGVNKFTTEIGPINTDCISSDAWEIIIKNYSIYSVRDSSFILAIEEINSEPFSTDLLYFSADPEEIIAIDKEHYSVRYVYNPGIADKVIDGLSVELTEIEKRRILDRIQLIIIDYQCPEGQNKSKELMKNR